jgi:hypothetical protein
MESCVIRVRDLPRLRVKTHYGLILEIRCTEAASAATFCSSSANLSLNSRRFETSFAKPALFRYLRPWYDLSLWHDLLATCRASDARR